MLARLAALAAFGGAVLASYGAHEHHGAGDWGYYEDSQGAGQYAMHAPIQEHSDYYAPKPHYEWHDSVKSHFEQPDPTDKRPHFPHPKKPVAVEKTIYEYLESEPKFSRLFRLVNFSSEITTLLNDSSKEVTFFALPNARFPKRPPKGKKPEKNAASFFDYLNPLSGEVADLIAVESIVDHVDDVLKAMEKVDAYQDRDHLKEIQKIVTAILSYHILPEKLSPVQLSQNTTFATSLKNVHGALDGEALRIRVGKTILPHILSINIYSKITSGLFTTSNGAFYTISKPLLPFPPAFDTTFLLQKHFSVFTSALQHVGLADSLKYSFRNPENTSAVVTVFAPTNAAFEHLPPRLQLFLFSPFGHRVLKKILQLHIVPNVTVHTDWILNKTTEASAIEYGAIGAVEGSEYAEFFPDDEEFDDFEGPDVYEHEWKGYGSRRVGPWWRDCSPPRGWPAPGFSWNTPPPPPPPSCGPPPPHAPFPPMGGHGAYPHHPPPFPPPHGAAPHPPPFSPMCGPPPHPHPPFSPPFSGPPPPPGGHGQPFAHGPGPFPGEPHTGHFRGPLPPFGPGACAPPPPPPAHGPWAAPHSPPHFPPGPHRPGQPSHPPPHHAPPKHNRPHITQNITLELPTLLTNHSLSVQLLKSEFKLPHLPPRTYSGVVVNGQPVVFADGTALNGAIHVVDRLIRPLRAPPKGSPPGRGHGHGPRGPGRRRGSGFEVVDEEWIEWAGEGGLGDAWVDEYEGDENEWEDWEEWLLEWAVKADNPELDLDADKKESD